MILMEKSEYKLGYDMMGRIIVIDANRNYVTHIPASISADEVLIRMQNGEVISFDARDPYLEWDIPILVAPPELEPLFYAWNQNFIEDPKDESTFEEFAQEFNQANLTIEEEWNIIYYWKNYIAIPDAVKISLKEFRRKYIEKILRKEIPKDIVKR